MSIIKLLLLLAMASLASAQPIQVYAHRGARAFCPENTLPAYAATLKIGADWLDMDVVLTRDNQVLVSHDPVLNPDIVRDEHGHFLAANRDALNQSSPEQRADYTRRYAARNLTLEELQRFDVGRLNPDSSYARYFPDQIPVDGTRMPTLLEVIHFARKSSNPLIGLQIEMKTAPEHPEFSADPKDFAAALYKILRDEQVIDRAEIQSFDFRCLEALQTLDRRVKTCYLTSREEEAATPGVALPRKVKQLGGFAWEPEDAQLTRETLEEAHRLGLKVVVWSWPEKLGTAFDAKLAARMIDWRVDGIITDDPGRLISMLAARGMAVPAR